MSCADVDRAAFGSDPASGYFLRNVHHDRATEQFTLVPPSALLEAMQSSCFLGLSRSFTQQLNHIGLRLALQRDLTRLGGPRSTFSSSAWRSNASCASKIPASRISQRADQLRGSLPFWVKAGGVAGVGLGLSAFTAPTVFCERE